MWTARLVILSLLAATATAQLDSSEKIDAGWFPAGTIETGDAFGRSVASIESVDGNDVVDYVIGAPGDDDGGLDRGAVYIIFSGPGLFGKIGSNTIGMSGILQDGDLFGTGLARIGDLNGDDVSEFAVLCATRVLIIYLDKGALASGQVVVASVAEIYPATDPCFQASSSNCGVSPTNAPTSVGEIGDLDGDGVSDLVVGFSDESDGCIVGGDCQCALTGFGSVGSVWILFLNANGTIKACQKISLTCGGFSMLGSNCSPPTGPLQGCPRFGSAVDGTLDRNGDGIRDLVVGSSGDDDGTGILSCGVFGSSGAMWVLHLNADGTVQSSQKVGATAGGPGRPTLAQLDQFGFSLSAVGDFDGDDIVDVAVGSPGRAHCTQSSLHTGSVWLILLNADGTAKSSIEFNPGCPSLLDQCGFSTFGSSVVALNDHVQKRPSLLVGAPGMDSNVAGTCIPQTGAAWLLVTDVAGSPFWSAVQSPVFCSGSANTNPVVFACSPAVIGNTWHATVGAVLPQHTSANITMKPGLACPPVATSYGQSWLSGPTLFTITAPLVGGSAELFLGIPPDPAYNELTFFAQARTFGGGSVKLTNAIELLVGFITP